MFTRYSQSVLPVVMSTQTRASWVLRAGNDRGLFALRRRSLHRRGSRCRACPLQTTGLDMPVTFSFFQATFSPVNGSHLSGRLVSRETPICSGPRQLVQSLASTGQR